MNPLSLEAKQALIERDLAHEAAKQNPNPETNRQFRHLRNYANTLIARERHSRKRQQYETSCKQKWKMAKMDTGQDLQETPSIIRDGEQNLYKAKRHNKGPEQTIY